MSLGADRKAFVILGPPGVGKGTQSSQLAQQLRVPHISTGDMFREAKAAGTALGLEAKRFMDRGQLVPDDVTIGLVRQRLGKEDATPGFLLDGFPRTVPQADELAEFAPLKAALSLTAPEDELVKRLAGRRLCRTCQAPYHVSSLPKGGKCSKDGGELFQRADDNEGAVRTRLGEYATKTLPLVAYYRSNGLLREIDGLGSVDEVSKRVIEAAGA